MVMSVLALSGAYGLSAQAQARAQAQAQVQPQYQAPYQAPSQAPAPSGEVSQPFYQKGMPAPSNAFEINGNVAYTQGWGNLTDNISPQGQVFGNNIQDFAGAGLQFELGLGYRVSPMLAVGAFGTFAEYHNSSPVDSANFRSVTAGIQGGWHLRPFRAVDPWVTLGSAWRGNWYVPEIGGITSRQGWEVARLQIGADLRLAPQVAIAPYVEGGLNLVFTEKLPNIDSRSLNGSPTYFALTAGVLARFDVGGSSVRPGGAVASR